MNRPTKTWMTKAEIIEALEEIADRLESIKTECDWSCMGYAGGAADLAATAVNHVIDLVQIAAMRSESNEGKSG